MTIASKLQKILEIKNNIKQALINKGVEVSNNFENFAEKIESIQGGESNNLPAGIAGLCVWLDAEINSRAGVHDESVNGMENLVFTPLVSPTRGHLEKLNGSPTFKDKAITLGGTCFYPAFKLNELTIEFCIDLNNYNFLHQFVIHRVNKGGFQVWLGGNLQGPAYQNAIVFSAFTSNGTETKSVVANTDNAKIYCTITSKLNTSNSTKFYINGELVSVSNLSDGVASDATEIINTGVGGVSSTGTSSVVPTSSEDFSQGAYHGNCINWSCFRVWSRQLSAEEIKQNYNRDKKRFG